jgi:hypothetical protein
MLYGQDPAGQDAGRSLIVQADIVDIVQLFVFHCVDPFMQFVRQS